MSRPHSFVTLKMLFYPTRGCWFLPVIPCNLHVRVSLTLHNSETDDTFFAGVASSQAKNMNRNIQAANFTLNTAEVYTASKLGQKKMPACYKKLYITVTTQTPLQ